MTRRRLSFMIAILALILLPLTYSPDASADAQSENAKHIFTWREAAMTIEYPADWLVGAYEGHTVVTSDAVALEKATQGQAPGSPFITFLFYPQARTLNTRALLSAIFPGVDGSDYLLGTAKGLRAEFNDESTQQHLLAISFESPATRSKQVLVAGADSSQWGDFAAPLDEILATAKFMRGSALLEVFGTKTTFTYVTEWIQRSNGQILVAAPSEKTVEGILAGNIQQTEPFVRAQVLVPSGIGVDPEAPTAAQDILLNFLGQTPEAIDVLRNFEWAEGMPAASALLDYEGLRLLMIVVVQGDSALVIGGGAPIAQWAESQAAIVGALNLSKFNDVAPLTLLTPIVMGQLETSNLAIIGKVQ